jgi:hypothetical protein
VQTAHCLPGRVRFRVPSLVGNANGRALVLQKLPGIQGVDSVSVDGTSGSVLIRYREEEVKPELLFAALVRLLGLDDELQRSPQPVLARELRTISQTLNRVVYDRTGGLVDLHSALIITMAAVGLNKLVAEGSRSFPAGFTLVWWALNSSAWNRGG